MLRNIFESITIANAKLLKNGKIRNIKIDKADINLLNL